MQLVIMNLLNIVSHQRIKLFYYKVHLIWRRLFYANLDYLFTTLITSIDQIHSVLLAFTKQFTFVKIAMVCIHSLLD